MCEEDVPQVAKLEEDNFSRPWSAKGFLDALNGGYSLFLVAKQDEACEILGYIGVSMALDEGEITQVVVSESARKCGIGTKLLAAMIDAVRSQGIVRLILEVRVSNRPAILLYEKNGFQTCGIRKNFYDFPTEDAYLMICELS
jgi:ribosomal-protein-alanine N-acetyltransferase